MGNEMSQEEEALFVEEAIQMSSLDDPRIDKEINMGTTAPNCQPKHTIRAAAAQCPSERSNSAIESRGERPPPRRTQSDNYDSRNKQKLGYLQMARAGYQELVNAIIRPPRADYRVRSFDRLILFFFSFKFIDI